MEEHEPLKAEIVDDGAKGRSTRGNSGVGEAANQQWMAFTATEPSAIIALGLAIASWVAIPIIGAIAALVIAPSAKRRIRESNGSLSGKSLATAAQIIGWLNLLCAVLIIWVMIQIIRWIF